MFRQYLFSAPLLREIPGFFVQVTQSCISEPQRPYTIAPPGQHGNQTTHLPFLVAITILSALFADLGDAFGCMMHHGLEHVYIYIIFIYIYSINNLWSDHPSPPSRSRRRFSSIAAEFGKERHLSGPPLKLLFSHDRPRMDS